MTPTERARIGRRPNGGYRWSPPERWRWCAGARSDRPNRASRCAAPAPRTTRTPRRTGRDRRREFHDPEPAELQVSGRAAHPDPDRASDRAAWTAYTSTIEVDHRGGAEREFEARATIRQAVAQCTDYAEEQYALAAAALPTDPDRWADHYVQATRFADLAREGTALLAGPRMDTEKG